MLLRKLKSAKFIVGERFINVAHLLALACDQPMQTRDSCYFVKVRIPFFSESTIFQPNEKATELLVRLTVKFRTRCAHNPQTFSVTGIQHRRCHHCTTPELNTPQKTHDAVARSPLTRESITLKGKMPGLITEY